MTTAPQSSQRAIEFLPFDMTAADIEFIASRQFQLQEVARIFRIPPHMIGELSRSTNNNIAQQAQEYVILAIADITRGGRSVKVSPRAALLVAALDRAKPNCVGDDFLIGKIWTQRPANARELLEDLIASLGSLKQIGLEIRTHRGIGRQLVETPL